jgi:hypothetical protein
VTPHEIEKRLYACSYLRAIDLSRFSAAGVPITALYQPDILARAQIEFAEQLPLFEFVDAKAEGLASASWAMIFIARDGFGEISDLVAWSPKSGRLAAWLGAACLLGGENIFLPRLNPVGALIVHRSPLEWLQAGRKGVVIVDDIAAGDLLSLTGPLEVRDRGYGAHLRRALARPAPRIVIAPPSLARAA